MEKRLCDRLKGIICDWLLDISVIHVASLISQSCKLSHLISDVFSIDLALASLLLRKTKPIIAKPDLWHALATTIPCIKNFLSRCNTSYYTDVVLLILTLTFI